MKHFCSAECIESYKEFKKIGVKYYLSYFLGVIILKFFFGMSLWFAVFLGVFLAIPFFYILEIANTLIVEREEKNRIDKKLIDRVLFAC